MGRGWGQTVDMASQPSQQQEVVMATTTPRLVLPVTGLAAAAARRINLRIRNGPRFANLDHGVTRSTGRNSGYSYPGSAWAGVLSEGTSSNGRIDATSFQTVDDPKHRKEA